MKDDSSFAMKCRFYIEKEVTNCENKKNSKDECKLGVIRVCKSVKIR